MRTKRYTILLSAVTALIIACVLTYILNPLALSSWVDAQRYGVNLPQVTTVAYHKTTTLVYALRSLLYRYDFGIQNWPFFAVPLIPLAFYLHYLFKQPTARLITFDQFSLALLLSFLLCPFGWIFDFVPLILIAYILILRRISLRGYFSLKDPVVLGLIMLNLFCFYLDALNEVGLHHFVFFGWGMLVLKKLNNYIKFTKP